MLQFRLSESGFKAKIDFFNPVNSKILLILIQTKNEQKRFSKFSEPTSGFAI
jgi:hypothetical protein